MLLVWEGTWLLLSVPLLREGTCLLLMICVCAIYDMKGRKGGGRDAGYDGLRSPLKASQLGVTVIAYGPKRTIRRLPCGVKHLTLLHYGGGQAKLEISLGGT